jgi:hypothetical protein
MEYAQTLREKDFPSKTTTAGYLGARAQDMARRRLLLSVHSFEFRLSCSLSRLMSVRFYSAP